MRPPLEVGGRLADDVIGVRKAFAVCVDRRMSTPSIRSTCSRMNWVISVRGHPLNSVEKQPAYVMRTRPLQDL